MRTTLLLAGGAVTANTQARTVAMPIAEGGPWDIEFRPEIRAHTFLINRETGEVFQLFEDKDVNPY